MIDSILIFFLGLNAAFLVFRRDYEDGLVGRLGLSVAVIGVVIILIGHWGGHFEYELPGEMTIIFAGIDGFLARHTYRWLKWRLRDGCDWRDKYKRGEPS